MKNSLKILDASYLMKNKKVLIVFPHPDDEAFFVSGLIQQVSSCNCSIKLICLTKGEASTLKYGLSDSEDLAQVRTNELNEVLNLLNIKDFSIENFPDKYLRDHGVEITNFLTAQIENFKPDILITYEPWGVYGHPDHIFISKIVTDLAKQKNIKVIYTTAEPGFKISESQYDVIEDVLAVKTTPPTHFIELTWPQFSTKLKTITLHKSQRPASSKDFIKGILSILKLKKEYFVLSE